MPDGDNLILGQGNTAESQTSLKRTGDEGDVYGLHVEFLDGHAVGGRTALGLGVEGTSFSGVGVKGICTQNEGVVGSSKTGPGVGGGSTSGPGVRGTSFQGFGVEGFCFGNQVGVQGTCHNHIGVRGDSDKHVGIRGRSTSGVGMRGSSAQQSDDFSGGVGVHGIGTNGSTAVAGVSQGGIGVLGIVTGGTGAAGLFQGNVFVTGTLFASAKAFMIDHPLDPKNKYLVHAAVESPDLKTVYDGVATLDRQGKAKVSLPPWFEALNKDFRYQLTSIGAAAPDLHIASTVSKNQFTIGGGAPGAKVSWQVTGIRRDRWAKSHPVSVEQAKRPHERIRQLYAEFPRQKEALSRWIKEDGAETAALISSQSKRMAQLQKRAEKEDFPAAP